MSSRAAALGVLCGLLGAQVPAQAAEAAHDTEYSISLTGLPIARARFHTELNGRHYTISGTLESAGLADIFSRTNGRTTVSGVVESDRLRAQDYSMRYQSGSKTRAIDMSFRNGNVVSTTLTPKKPTPKNWIPVSPADLRSVLDPLSGLVIPEGTRVCPSTLPIFDGESRLDIRLVDKGTKPFSTQGFKGDVIVCGLRFVPKSGYRKGRRDVEYLRKLETMEIWFAKSDAVKVYAPVYARIPTTVGPVTVWATRFEGS
ncbi:hypothetical protein BJF93_01310 [Xaviernesmea oryzae]|uniref:DUF3108 domain-containing protein n=1 Tax=Xaviernesmea oryzae TaxID=464029 RepID=A0A1Q9B293_9HYPH|nr:DUF3108 domain-containing protein [Xaviernesmea oryzae]OLP62116.1 hypothetical protein BJF93_01310 [Xaviernesmea oryzae]SEL87966.1 Protein of unknown function [Xaviernesmea oryzae]